MIGRFFPPQRMVVHLSLFAATIGIPLFLLASLAGYFAYRDGVKALDQQARRLVYSSATMIEREFQVMINKAKTLALDQSLREGRLAEFHAIMLKSPGITKHWVTVTDSDGRQLMSTRFPYGQALRVSSQTEALQQTVFARRATYVSNAFKGRDDTRVLMLVSVPVLSVAEDRVIYSLNVVAPAEAWQETIDKISKPDGYLMSIIDPSGTIIARTLNPEKWVGQKATKHVIDQIAATAPGSEPNWGDERKTVEGLDVKGGHARLASGWAVGVSVLNSTYYEAVWKLLSLLLLFMAIFVVLAGLMAYIQGRTITKALNNLRESSAQPQSVVTPVIEVNVAIKSLVAQMNEQQNLLRELHHRVKNNLQTVASVLRLQMVSVRDDKAKEALNEAIHRVMAMGKVHETLYEAKSTKVEAVRYIDMLVDHVAESLPGVNVTKNMQALPMPLIIDHLVPIALLINEVVVNASKHAKTKGVVNVHIELAPCNGDEYCPEGNWSLMICDDGPGFPEHVGQSKSLGMKLIRAMGQQLNGTITLTNTPGACVRLVAPLPAESPFKSAI